MLTALRALSYPDVDVKQNYLVDRALRNITNPPIKTLARMTEFKLDTGDVSLDCGVFLPDRIENDECIFFIHGGGWVTGDIASYSLTCRNMARISGRLVIAIDYRRAPEHKFPTAVEDCYNAALALIRGGSLFRIAEDKLIIAGDSAGGNIAAALSLMAADRGEFRVRRQILVYPAVYCDHSDTSPFDSVRENGTDYLLTSKQICDYMSMYMRDCSDCKNPYFSPLLAESLTGQPRTLMITAEFDPLRDEGEAYAKRLHEAGCKVEHYRIPDALHGFFTLPIRFTQPKVAQKLIRTFLDKGID